MRAVIFVNGIVADYERLAHWLAPDDFLICADGGTRHALMLGLTPHLIVGDVDSVEPADLARLEAAGTRVRRYPPEKDQTDLELALEAALEAGAQEVLLLGALGGRLDQTLANLLILAQRDWPAAVRIAEGNQVAQMMHDGDTLELDGPVGSIVSAIPLSSEVTGISYTGLQYPLTNGVLRFGSTRGVSNVLAETPAAIRIERGNLLVIQGLPA